MRVRMLKLFPRQAFLAPAGNGSAVVAVVERAFEPIEHVVDLAESGFFERYAGVERAMSAPADQHDRPIHARNLLHLTNEMRIDFPVGPVIPRDVVRAYRVADEKILHLAPTVDENGGRSFVEESCGFAGL